MVAAGVARLGWGEVIGYGELARSIGRPGAARAVGGAVGRNPVGLFVNAELGDAGEDFVQDADTGGLLNHVLGWLLKCCFTERSDRVPVVSKGCCDHAGLLALKVGVFKHWLERVSDGLLGGNRAVLAFVGQADLSIPRGFPIGVEDVRNLHRLGYPFGSF